MTTVSVKKLNETTFEVKVEAHSTTTHVVTVQPEYAIKLTGGKAPRNNWSAGPSITC
jgi:hypothetical protein